MKTWFGKAGRAAGMGVAWGFAWACLGMAIELFEPDPSFIDVWVTTLAIPGLAGGMLFSIVLQAIGRGVDELSPARSFSLGAVAGLLLALLVIATTTLLDVPPGPRAAGVVIAASMLLSAVTALGLHMLVEKWPVTRQQRST